MDRDGVSGGGEAPARRYKGVRLRKWGRWVSEIRMPNSRERIWLGSYESAEKAARAFDAAAVCLRGSRGAGSLNFPESPPDVRYFPGAVLTVEQIQAEAARHANSLDREWDRLAVEDALNTRGFKTWKAIHEHTDVNPLHACTVQTMANTK
ncbi:ethylene-responsive transcription factor ERF017-like [Oryza brachyantha]|uniref:ethylene-responsive transcription factor ERF017-like n=1 Tax=Oryza brachyantha TaxID=4533 RepID=UPI0007763C0F|nr:ethylene-responsive transcription factor ERF017-like [Oryza brachyantha]